MISISSPTLPFLQIERFSFPVGESHVRVSGFYPEQRGMHVADLTLEVCTKISGDEIMDLLLVADALKNAGIRLCKLSIPYMPFGRQDRAEIPGEAFSLSVFARLINDINAETVETVDPHSDVTTALIKNCHVIHQDEVFEPLLPTNSDFYLISPDGGALKKIYKLAAKTNCLDVIECSKKRNVKTGVISETKVHGYVNDKDCYIVDDICDGGRTFIEIAKLLKAMGARRVILMVTHGFFTKGLEVFDGLIDEIYTRKGKVK